MFGLTEEEYAALSAAKAVVRAAQATIERLEAKSREGRIEAMHARKRACRPFNPMTLLDRVLPRHDFPKPSSKTWSRARHIGELLNPPLLPQRTRIHETFSLVRSFAGLASTHSLDHAQTKRALQDAGIDICEEVARDWDCGISIQELSRRHGVGRDTISRWIRKTGREIMPRNSNWRYDEALIAKTFVETQSVNKAARAAGVSWATARSVLSRYRIRAEGRSTPVSVSRL